MENRIKDKIEEIEQYLSELSQALPSTFKECEKDLSLFRNVQEKQRNLCDIVTSWKIK